jgi:hypothetical protein
MCWLSNYCGNMLFEITALCLETVYFLVLTKLLLHSCVLQLCIVVSNLSFLYACHRRDVLWYGVDYLCVCVNFLLLRSITFDPLKII